MRKYIKTTLAIAIAAITIALAIPTQAQSTQTKTISISKGTSGGGCPGTYLGYLKMTNSLGTYWVTPPAGTSYGTLSDVSGYGAPYVSVATVVRQSDFMTWCGTNGVSFPATNTMKYSLTIYVKVPTPTNATTQTVTGQIVW
jgi:hypothetical protein